MPPDAPATRGVARRGLFETYRREGRSVWIEASGASMRPLIAAGDWLLVDFGRCPARIGEIVLFAGGRGLVVHRMVARDGPSRLVTKGDGTPHCDSPLAAGEALGVVSARRRGAAGPSRTFGCAGLPAWAIARLSLGAAALVQLLTRS